MLVRYRNKVANDKSLPVVSVVSNFSNLSNLFSAQQHIAHMLSALYVIARLFVCPSVARPSITRVDRSKTAEVRITKFPIYSSSIPLVSAG